MLLPVVDLITEARLAVDEVIDRAGRGLIETIFGTELGTRHRAAVGITEETDAVAVVVSEETGSISLATGGSIEINLSAEQLAERLSQIFHQPVSRATPVTSRAPTLERTPPAPTRSA